MISILLCLLAFVLSVWASRRSPVTGLGTVLAIGYFYGITRVHVVGEFSHFIFDAGVLGLYLAQWRRLVRPMQQAQGRKLQQWVFFLILWPALLFVAPVQDPLVELVGLRGHIFLLPFLLLGARFSSEELYQLALWLGALNLIVFGFAVAEFLIGVEPFYPYREGLTTLIYASDDAAGIHTALRIPATFSSAHAYAGTMVMSSPFLLEVLAQPRRRAWHRSLFAAALAASIIGIFMSATRLNVILMFVLLIVAAFSSRLSLSAKVVWLMVLLGIGWIVSGDARLQRFTTLQEEGAIGERVVLSVNDDFMSLMMAYPMGNGLGGGGTNMPYFLQSRVKKVMMENEYARIMLEQGVPGLCLWVGFILWLFAPRRSSAATGQLGRRLAWVASASSFALGALGIGLLMAIPQTCLLLMCAGRIAVPRPQEAVSRAAAKPRREPVAAAKALA